MYEIRDSLVDLINNINTVNDKYSQNELFVYAIKEDLIKWKKSWEYWSKGKYRSENEYIKRLKHFYTKAEKEVFSTSIPTYSENIWNNPALEKTLISAHSDNHRLNNTKITRVFLFESIDEAMLRIDVLKRHSKHGFIDNKIVISPFDELFKDAKLMDFTIIDNEFVGITEFSNLDKKKCAIWHVNEKDYDFHSVMDTKNQLLANSKPLKDWLISIKRKK